MKKNIYFFVLWFQIFIIFNHIYSDMSVITTAGGGLLGDKLLIYIKAKWFSYAYNLKFFYTASKDFDKLVLHEYEKQLYNQEIRAQFKSIKKIGSRKERVDLEQKDTLFFAGLRSFDPYWKKFELNIKKSIVYKNTFLVNKRSMPTFIRVNFSKVDVEQCLWEDHFYENYIYFCLREHPDFLKQMRELIAPGYALDYIPLPKDKITVALHVRKGGEFEPLQKSYPKEISLRVPQDNYYIEQLKRLSEMINDKPMYVFIFTNHINPSLLIEEYKKVLNKSNIEFDCRKQSSNKDNVLEDLFSMTRFDCLIRPNSAFSKIAQIIGNHKIIIYPVHGIWKNPELIVDKVGVIRADDIVEDT